MRFAISRVGAGDGSCHARPLYDLEQAHGAWIDRMKAVPEARNEFYSVDFISDRSVDIASLSHTAIDRVEHVHTLLSGAAMCVAEGIDAGRHRAV